MRVSSDRVADVTSLVSRAASAPGQRHGRVRGLTPPGSPRLLSLAWLLVLLPQLAAAQTPAEPIDFGRQIQPILAKRCYACHGPDKAEGGLRLNSKEAAFAKLELGTHAISPKDVAKSELIARVTSREDGKITITRVSDKVALVTQHAGAEMRPYLHPIQSPDGKGELTEFSPGHHKHQTGLYWGFTRVNGRDYFHNNKGDSWRRKEIHVLETKRGQAKWQVVYDMLGAEGKPVLTETQTWLLSDYGGHYTLDLEWQGLAVVDVTFGEYAYGGLFLRMPWTDKSGGEAINSEGLANGKAEGAKARWVDVGMPIAGRDDWGHVVIMDHPKNDGHPTLWRVDGQLGVGPCRARSGEWQLPSGQTATFRHRILVYTGKTDREKVESQWDAYIR